MTGRDTPARGRGGAQSNRQAPTGTGHRGRHNTGAGSHKRARKGKDQGPWRRVRGHNGGHKGAHTGRARHNGGTSTAPAQRTPRDPRRRMPANTRRRSTDLTAYRPHRLTPTGHRDPHRGRRAHPHGKKGLHQPRESPRTPPGSPTPRPQRQATTPDTARATTQAPEEEDDTTAAPRARGKNPQRTRHGSTGPQGGQTRGHPPHPPARAAQQNPRSRDHASHPTINRTPQPPASHKTSTRVPHHDTGQSNHQRPNPTPPPRHNTRQHGTPHRSAPPCNAP